MDVWSLPGRIFCTILYFKWKYTELVVRRPKLKSQFHAIVGTYLGLEPRYLISQSMVVSTLLLCMRQKGVNVERTREISIDFYLLPICDLVSKLNSSYKPCKLGSFLFQDKNLNAIKDIYWLIWVQSLEMVLISDIAGFRSSNNVTRTWHLAILSLYLPLFGDLFPGSLGRCLVAPDSLPHKEMFSEKDILIL